MDVRIIEKGGDFGGTWYWNRYPGAQCDTASMVYLPLLEETGHMPTEKYVHGQEILAHCQRIGRQFGLYDDALFHTEVTGLTWDEAHACWVIQTSRGDRLTARFVVLGTGPLSAPKLPGIPGIGSFGGHSFHTSRWDYDYTGGDSGGAPMHALAGKRVGIIGTGATAVQCVPHLARDSRELYVFQRTPSSVDVRNNHPIDPHWFAEMAAPGWQQRWLENFTANQAGGTADEDLVQDGWTDIARRIRARIALLSPEDRNPAAMLTAYEESDFEKMEEIRARADAMPTRTPRATSRPGTASCASGRAFTTITCRPSTTRTRTWSTQTARAYRKSPRPAWSPPAGNTSWSASSTAPASRSAPPTPAGPASR